MPVKKTETKKAETSVKHQHAVVSQVRLFGGNTHNPVASSVFLAQPNMCRHSAELESERFTTALASMQGWRRTMEDAHVVELALDADASLFAVFDGHGGHDTALAAAANMADWIRRSPHFAEGRYSEALREAYIYGDSEVCALLDNVMQMSGSTAVTVIVTSTHAYCANVGDSRAVLCRGTAAHDLSTDHKPNLAEEIRRVTKAGGVIQSGRVNGMLAMTRALGDPMFKKKETEPENQVVTAVPEITVTELTRDDGFIVIACDGVWDCLSSQEVVDFFLEEAHEHGDYALMCENLCENLVAPTLHQFGTDNMTIMVIRLRALCPELPTAPMQSPLTTGLSRSRRGSFKSGQSSRSTSAGPVTPTTPTPEMVLPADHAKK
jgi:serine/threonine protein phosphatase PrpC